jgi:hypothetical protein
MRKGIRKTLGIPPLPFHEVRDTKAMNTHRIHKKLEENQDMMESQILEASFLPS